MKTQIFESYSEFLKREDKNINGVSPEFAEAHPDYEKDNETNTGCWNCYRCYRCSDCSGCSGCSGCSRCSDCSGCSRCSRCSGCSDCSDCSGCSGCSDCSGCSRCSDCSRCSRCSGCSDCSDCSGCSRCSDCSRCSRCSDCSGVDGVEGKKKPETPTIENIDSALYAAASAPQALDMGDWHKCGTTHCRAGWIVHLAGEEGYALEEFFNTELAAMKIYEKSTGRKLSPVKFYQSNNEALEDMRRYQRVNHDHSGSRQANEAVDDMTPIKGDYDD